MEARARRQERFARHLRQRLHERRRRQARDRLDLFRVEAPVPRQVHQRLRAPGRRCRLACKTPSRRMNSATSGLMATAVGGACHK